MTQVYKPRHITSFFSAVEQDFSQLNHT